MMNVSSAERAVTKTKYLARVAAYFKGEFARLLAARDAELLEELKEMRSPVRDEQGRLVFDFRYEQLFYLLERRTDFGDEDPPGSLRNGKDVSDFFRIVTRPWPDKEFAVHGLTIDLIMHARSTGDCLIRIQSATP
ncbi:hypothetical protein KIF53_15640 [Chromobacterium subtsugae]|uniref:Uncharacterized protein n=1 Tax=Chromobacterium subtsugae TaxID=251747 RepID=A0ABS7FH35_9NEIS|nr:MULTISPECIES: hypothetical protein [Chromobacterium]MBW7567839.1 hypothetical protein [Chromobacterium subtsugae]MBW8289066.1 hypothetical protein [Chromobacterium subtsugae]WSE93789.1 hypothetical protein U6115_11255 [Chromobacterium subtsugae]WVH62166.1 hypothetical protein U6151_11275 [Chromobacterium subtsugae]